MRETPEPKRPADQPQDDAAAPEPEDEKDAGQAYSSEEEAEVAARLESLGYM